MQSMTTWRRLSLGALLAVVAAAAPQAQDHMAETEAWRAEREARLTADDGWLTVAGLFFLTEGDKTFGSSPLNDIVLRAGPQNAGVFTLRRGEITVRAPAGETLTIDDRETEGARLWPYEGGSRPTITVGPLSLFGHYSGDRLAIRMRDRDSEIRRNSPVCAGSRSPRASACGAGTSPTPSRGRCSSRTSSATSRRSAPADRWPSRQEAPSTG